MKEIETKNEFFIEYIKQARIKKGMTQQQLADLANISKPLIGKAESYKQKYSETAIKKIFKALDLEPPELPEDLREPIYITSIRPRIYGMNKKTEKKLKEIYDTKNKKLILALNKAIDSIYILKD